MIKEYKCIKAFCVCCFDLDSDSFDETEFYDVEVGSIWQRETNYVSSPYTEADIHLDGDNGWLEISEEMLRDCFEELQGGAND